ncbi:MAG TPA: hypothetical protein VGF94_21500 [Kofleriaceae bacterium]|jgi:hypothetical protein
MSEGDSKIPSAVLRAWRGLRGTAGEPSRTWLAAGAPAAVVVGFHSCQSVEAGQVAVRVNNVSGSMEVITQPEAADTVKFNDTLTFSSAEGLPSVLRPRQFAEQFMGAR